MRVSVFGSCITRDVFRLFPDVGEVASYHSRSSLISVTAPPLEFDDAGIAWPSNFAHKVVRADFRKTFFDDLEAARPDALIVDLMSERFDLLRRAGTYVTRSWELLESGFDVSRFDRVSRETNAMHVAWCDSGRAFAHVLRERFPTLQVILHKAHWTLRYRDGSVVRPFPWTWRRAITRRNEMLDTCHAELELLLPGLVVVAPRGCYIADAGHRWGLGSSHYEHAYYDDVREQLQAALHLHETAVAA